MDFSVSVDGLADIKTASENVKRAVNAELESGLFFVGQRVRTSAIESLNSGNKTGKIYKRGNKTHTASAAGEAPATDTGRLAGSIISRVDGMTAIIIAGRGLVKYARMLEFGTRFIAERPFMMPAYEKNKKWIKDRMRAALIKGLQRGTK